MREYALSQSRMKRYDFSLEMYGLMKRMQSRKGMVPRISVIVPLSCVLDPVLDVDAPKCCPSPAPCPPSPVPDISDLSRCSSPDGPCWLSSVSGCCATLLVLSASHSLLGLRVVCLLCRLRLPGFPLLLLFCSSPRAFCFFRFFLSPSSLSCRSLFLSLN